jgi:hypothetical protein
MTESIWLRTLGGLHRQRINRGARRSAAAAMPFRPASRPAYGTINRKCLQACYSREGRRRASGLTAPSPPAEKPPLAPLRRRPTRPARSLIRSVPRLRMLDEHHFRSLGNLVVRNLDRIADVDNVGN